MFERIAFVVIVLSAAPAVHAQACPAKPVRVWSLRRAGLSTSVTRIVAERLSQDLAQPFVVEKPRGRQRQRRRRLRR